MLLFLDHQQRLNVIALVGMQRGTVAEIRQLWALQDKLELDEDEKLQINYRVVSQDGMEQVRWNSELPLPTRDFDLSLADCQKLRQILEEYTGYQVTDRKWLVPLLDQLLTPETAERPLHTTA